jgi:hypothetical protein
VILPSAYRRTRLVIGPDGNATSCRLRSWRTMPDQSDPAMGLGQPGRRQDRLSSDVTAAVASRTAQLRIPEVSSMR